MLLSDCPWKERRDSQYMAPPLLMGRAIADHANVTEFSPQPCNESIPHARTCCAFLSTVTTKNPMCLQSVKQCQFKDLNKPEFGHCYLYKLCSSPLDTRQDERPSFSFILKT